VLYRVVGDGMVKHYHIKRTDGGQFYINESHLFNSLPELIVHHKHEASGQHCNYIAQFGYCLSSDVFLSSVKRVCCDKRNEDKIPQFSLRSSIMLELLVGKFDVNI